MMEHACNTSAEKTETGGFPRAFWPVTLAYLMSMRPVSKKKKVYRDGLRNNT